MSRTIRDRIVKVERIGNSRAGNPLYDVVLESGAVYQTEPDASVNYEIKNPEFVGSKGYGIRPPTVDFRLNFRGRIISATPIT